MLKAIRGNKLLHQCNVCDNEEEKTLGSFISQRNRYSEFENFTVECSCGAVEVFNLNLPPEPEEDEPFDMMPVEEEIQRYYVRLLQRIVREDFIDAES